MLLDVNLRPFRYGFRSEMSFKICFFFKKKRKKTWRILLINARVRGIEVSSFKALYKTFKNIVCFEEVTKWGSNNNSYKTL